MTPTFLTLELHEDILQQLLRGDYETALYGLRRFIMLFPPTHEGRADVHTVTAYACLQLDKIEEAVAAARRALAMVPHHPLAQRVLRDALARGRKVA